MKEITAYQCEKCKDFFIEKSSIRVCASCNVEICDECCSMKDDFCWKCYGEGKDLEKES